MKSKYYDWTKELIEQGHIYTEIAEIQGRDPHNVRKLCIATGLDKLIDREDPIKRMAEQLQEKGYDLISCSGGVDGVIKIRCRTCGGVIERNGQAARKPYRILCECCREEKKRQARIQKDRNARAADLKRVKPIQAAMTVCKGCGEMFIPHRKGLAYCSEHCMKRVINARQKDRRIRKMRAVVVDTNITLQRLYDRDGGRCALCGMVCDWNDHEVRDDGTFIAFDRYPSIDHKLPLSRGGLHAWDNVQLACRACNYKKGASV